MGYYDDELMHYGVKGMKWGVRRAVDVSNVIKKHGSNQIQKKQQLYAMRSKRSKKDGHKIRAAYYKRKSYKLQDKQYDDIGQFVEGLRDISIKSTAVINAARLGSRALEGMLEERRYRKDYNERRKLASTNVPPWVRN